jgi:hypothetical protein
MPKNRTQSRSTSDAQPHVDPSPAPPSEAAAAQLMWDHYKRHKALLRADIRDSRDYILAELMKGRSPSDVFAAFVVPDRSAPIAATKPKS